MTDTAVTRTTRTTRRTSTRSRDLAVVGAATALAGATWALLTQLLDVRLTVPAGDGGSYEVGAVAVLVSALVSGLAGTLLLWLLEARLAQGLLVWTGVATLALLLSFGGPSTAATTGAVVGLAALHVVVAVALIGGLHAARRA